MFPIVVSESTSRQRRAFAHHLRHADGRIEATVGTALKAVKPNDAALLQWTLLHVHVDPVAFPVGMLSHDLLQFMNVVT